MRCSRKRKVAVWVGLPLAVALAVAIAVPPNRHTLLGYLRREPTYRGRPARYWAWEAGRWRVGAVGSDRAQQTRSFYRERPPWAAWLGRAAHPDPFGARFPLPLLQGDPEAVPVLAALLAHDDATVRRIAAAGLAQIGLPARAAAPALLPLLRDADAEVRGDAGEALYSIDPEAAERAGVGATSAGVPP